MLDLGGGARDASPVEATLSIYKQKLEYWATVVE
jgi:hypothetical protein